MKSIGIVIDDWKLKIFQKHLDAAGLTFEQKELMKGTLLLTIKIESKELLWPIVTAAMKECRNQ